MRSGLRTERGREGAEPRIVMAQDLAEPYPLGTRSAICSIRYHLYDLSPDLRVRPRNRTDETADAIVDPPGHEPRTRRRARLHRARPLGLAVLPDRRPQGAEPLSPPRPTAGADS